jgi:hypothetical protein
MFGHKSDPSKIYAYGCNAAISNSDAVDEQFSLAHRYRNRLCEIELERRKSVEQLLRTIPSAVDWQTAQSAVDQASVAIEAAADAIKQLHAAGTPKIATKDQRKHLAELKAQRKELAIVAKGCKAEALADPSVKAALKDIDTAAQDSVKAARAECGLYWGSYLKVEQDCGSFRQGKPPRFARWTGDGTLAVQIQGGASWADILAGKVRGLKIVPDPARSTPRKIRVIARLVVGGSRTAAMYADFPMTYHRPIPEDGMVKWIYLTRRMVASHQKYQLCFVVARSAGWARHDTADDGMVAINLGWRTVADGLRVATWVGSDGAQGSLVIPIERLQRWDKVESLQSIRDDHFNEAVESLATWLAGRTVPDWLTERTQHLRKWRSPGKLASLVLYWRGNRFDGDEAIFQRLEGHHDGTNYHQWRRKDKHLWEWQSHQRRGNLAWRQDLYRNLAADLSRRYHTLVVGDINYATMFKTPDVEADNRQTVAGRNRGIASPGALTRMLRERFADTLVVDAKHITDTCSVCGKPAPFDQIGSVRHTCQNCGAMWDQDENACRNMLSRALVTSETA